MSDIATSVATSLAVSLPAPPTRQREMIENIGEFLTPHQHSWAELCDSFRHLLPAPALRRATVSRWNSNTLQLKSALSLSVALCCSNNSNNSHTDSDDDNNNKSAQSNLGRGPRRGAVAHVRRKVLIGYNVAPQIRPQKYPFPWTDPQTPLPASCLDPSDLRCQTASGSDPPFFHNALERPTDRGTYVRTDRPTDRPRESLTTIGRCATRGTRPNK